MAVTSSKTTASKADETPEPAKVDTKAESKTEADEVVVDRRACVVKADFHVGQATPGSKVCSYHAMHYAADGSKRA